MIEQGRRCALTLAASLLVGMLTCAGVAAAADDYRVTGAKVAPADGGTLTSPRPVSIAFGLGVSAEDRSLRPAPIKTYVVAAEGLVAFPKAFPSCSLSQVKVRRGPAKACAKAAIGGGLIRAAAGFEEDPTMAESLPCNLRLRLYNTGAGMALRVDTSTPVPRNFKSRAIGCPVPIHTAIRGSLTKTTIDETASMDLSFTLPKRLLRPLAGWVGALQLVNATLNRATASARIKGHMRSVGYFSAVGCRGATRTVRAAFVDESGARYEATRAIAC